jgi:hypothetical protein
VPSADTLHDRQAQPGTAGIAGPRLVEAHEAVEHPLSVLSRYARSVVLHRHEHVGSLNRHRDDDGPLTVTHGVVDQVGDRTVWR